MKFLIINGELIGLHTIARATFNEGTLTVNLVGAGQHVYTGPEAEAAWQRLQEEVAQ